MAYPFGAGRFIRLTAGVLLLVVISACGNANWSSIYRQYELEPESDRKTTLIDA